MVAKTQEILDFAHSLADQTAWTPDIQQQLMDFIREPALAITGQVIPPNDRTKAMDNLYRCAPKGWQRQESELPPLVENGPSQGNVAGFQKWSNNGQPYLGLASNHELGSGPRTHKTLMLAMTAATAIVWVQIMREAGYE